MLQTMAPGTWRLIVDPPLSGRRNMARDLALLAGVLETGSPPVLRFYRWDPPCLSLGRHQDGGTVDTGYCRKMGIDILRRPTGGRAVLHHRELTYAVVAPLGRDPFPAAFQECYRLVCTALARGLRSLGIDAELGGGEFTRKMPGPKSPLPCFQAPAGGEILVAGRKLVGSAMRVQKGVFLQHGSILLDWDPEVQASSLRSPDPEALSASIVTIRELAGTPGSIPSLLEHIRAAFSDTMGVVFRESRPSALETETEERILRTRTAFRL